MANRFRDTGIWTKAWFRKLTPTMKCVWDFLCDNCDHAGFWEIDEDNFRHFIGEDITVDQVTAAFGDRIRVVGDKLWLTGFVEYQYKVPVEGLNPENKVHLSVINLLKKQGLYKPLSSPLQGAKDIEKEKETEKDKEKEEAILNFDAKTQEIFANLPLITKDTLTGKYPQSFLKAGVEECVSFHLNEPGSAKWQPGVWGKKLTTWLIEKKRREGGTEKVQPLALEDIPLADYSAKEGA